MQASATAAQEAGSATRKVTSQAPVRRPVRSTLGTGRVGCPGPGGAQAREPGLAAQEDQVGIGRAGHRHEGLGEGRGLGGPGPGRSGRGAASPTEAAPDRIGAGLGRRLLRAVSRSRAA